MTHLRRKMAAVLAVPTLLAVSACSTTPSSTSSLNAAAGTKNVEVFTWWAVGGEKAGLDGMISVFKRDCAQYAFVNAAAEGGSGNKARTLLANNLKAGNSPSSFQTHAGGELGDYIANDQVEDITGLFKEAGLDNAFPKDLVNQITVAGKIYSVPANIHRANMVWVNPVVLKKANLDPNKAPATVKDWITDLAKLRAAGVARPLVLSKGFAEEMLLETTLLADLGVDKFNGLYNGTTKWDGADVTTALGDVKTLLGYSNTDRETMDWDAAMSKYLLPADPTTAAGGYQVMGDWVPAQVRSLRMPASSYTYWPAPGTDGVYQWLSDSFTLPKGGTNPEGAKCWLKVVGSADGQKAFNVVKGSIPARSDATSAGYPAYQRWAMSQWKACKLALSLAHGSAGPGAWNDDVQSAMSAFSVNSDAAALQKALVAAATKYSGWRSALR